jgi:transmembrane sensor
MRDWQLTEAMTTPAIRLISDTSAHDQAAAWFARQRVAPLSESEEAEFATWLKFDAAHATAWSEYERIWDRIETVRDDPRMLAIREDARRHAVRRIGARRTRSLAVALAASVVVGIAIWWGGDGTGDRPNAGVRVAQTPTNPAPSSDLIREAATQVGERSLLVLADGSKVTLNTASAVRADYTGHDRRLVLVRGEAYFEVAKDPTRPFVVTAGSRQVIAVGTAFAVRLQDRQVRVTLVEGKVRVIPTATPGWQSASDRSSAEPVMLVAGSALVADASGAEHVERLDTARATSWRSGKLIFEGERLADVVAEMNRYSTEQLEISDPKLAERQVSGVFEPAEAHAFAKALEAYGIARVGEHSNGKIVLEAPN